MTPQIDAYAGEPQYIDHLAPIWKALPPKARGTFYVRTRFAATAHHHHLRIKQTGTIPPAGHRPILVASAKDANRAGPTRTIIYVEHGAGQFYHPPPPTHPRPEVILALLPSTRVTDYYANAGAFPNATLAAVGCPKLDAYLATPKPTNAVPVVALGWHWASAKYPEAGTAFHHYALRHGLRRLAAAFPGILGHAHPRIWEEAAGAYRAAGIEPVAGFDQIVARADVYAADNTSTIWEFAAIDRPVVLLNAPSYRPRARHGLRFWDAADIGLQAGNVDEAIAAIRATIAADPQAKVRRSKLPAVYAHLDGTASHAAANAIMTLITSKTTKGRCSICGAPGHVCGGPTTILATDIETKEDNMGKLYRVARRVNGADTILKVSEAQLTPEDRTALGLDKARRKPAGVQKTAGRQASAKPRGASTKA